MTNRFISVHLCRLCLVAAFLVAITGAQPSTRELRYALFTSGPEGAFDTSGAVPSMQLAEEEVFRDASVLEGFNLTHMAVQDTLVIAVRVHGSLFRCCVCVCCVCTVNEHLCVRTLLTTNMEHSSLFNNKYHSMCHKLMRLLLF